LCKKGFRGRAGRKQLLFSAIINSTEPHVRLRRNQILPLPTAHLDLSDRQLGKLQNNLNQSINQSINQSKSKSKSNSRLVVQAHRQKKNVGESDPERRPITCSPLSIPRVSCLEKLDLELLPAGLVKQPAGAEFHKWHRRGVSQRTSGRRQRRFCN
jgi:hypothetical protein